MSLSYENLLKELNKRNIKIKDLIKLVNLITNI